MGMAARAGALIADAEFVQFHPTAIATGADPAPLATEALRGEDVQALRFANLQLRIERAANVRNIEQYISRVDEMVERKRALILPEEKP